MPINDGVYYRRNPENGRVARFADSDLLPVGWPHPGEGWPFDQVEGAAPVELPVNTRLWMRSAAALNQYGPCVACSNGRILAAPSVTTCCGRCGRDAGCFVTDCDGVGIIRVQRKRGDMLLAGLCADHMGAHIKYCHTCDRSGLAPWMRPRNAQFGCQFCHNDALTGYRRGGDVMPARPRVDARLSIRSYSYKPDPKFFGKSREGLYFGLEQEVEARPGQDPHDLTKAVLSLDKHGLLYAKSDSSMFNGVEFVSHPMSFSWFMNNYPVDLAAKLQELADNQWGGKFTCGVHCHLSRDAFSAYHLFKFVQFFTNNIQFIQEVAGRDDWCDDARRGRHQIAQYEKDAIGMKRVRDRRTGDIVMSADARIKDLSAAGKGNHPWDMPDNRYVAVNLQNRATVEVRVFRGTVKLERLRAYVQFVHALYGYTKIAKWHSKDTMRGLTEVGFRAWIRDYPVRYGDLHKLLAREGAWAEA